MENAEHIVKKKIVINAKPSAVWDALTNPEKTKKYFFKCKVISDWKPGSTITFKGNLFFIINMEMKGEILKIEPENILQYTLANHGSPGFSTVTETLQYINDRTTLTITDDVGTEDGAEKRYKKSVKGWDKILKGLKELVESEN